MKCFEVFFKMFWSEGRKHVPKGRGPYTPGCCDLIDNYGRDALFIRVYYPSSSSDDVNKWPKWLPDDSYVAGIAGVLNLWPFIVRTLVWLMSGTVYVPAVYGAPLLKKQDKKLGCILLSHGLGGNRFLYTATCVELASHGFVVFAIEHRDGSACRTYYYQNKDEVIQDKKTFIEHKKVELGSSHYSARNAQVHSRSEELKRATDLIHALNSGQPIKNILVDVEKTEFDLKSFANNLDVDRLTMLGHSFGAATALVTLTKEPRLKQGILLDTWMFPVKDENLATKVLQPLIFINTQTFQIASNVKCLKPLLERNGVTTMYTLLNTTHESQTDSTFVIGHWLNWFMKKLEPTYAVRITCSLMFKYLKEYTEQPEDIDVHEEFLKKHSHNYYDGLTRPWA